MPNWSFNHLKVSGKKDDLKKFVEKSLVKIIDENSGQESITFSMNATYPMPKELEETQSPVSKQNKKLIEKYGTDNWYDWRINNWGTKWDTSSVSYDVFDTEFYVDFDTAWSPPVLWLEKVIQDYPELIFDMDWLEESNAFCGRMICKDGQVDMFDEGDPVFTDPENGSRVVLHSEINFDGWKYVDNDELIIDENFFPNAVNPYIDNF